jgi:hypothetical protein
VGGVAVPVRGMMMACHTRFAGVGRRFVFAVCVMPATPENCVQQHGSGCQDGSTNLKHGEDDEMTE